MNRNSKFDQDKWSFFKRTLLVLMVVAYPILVSIYTMLPPLIGLVGYIIITNVDKNRVYALSGMLYLVNLDLNLTLPMLLSIFVIVMIYLLLYSNLKLLIRCRVCLLFILITMVDLFYYMSLFLYDFMFNTSTVIGDMLLVYYIVVDIFIGVLL
ncbi:hypothetical protein KKC13_00205 [bacterium]|nr:hypothetical protein [bacterium]MBU1956803.1 hypothetical protein [bacterium]